MSSQNNSTVFIDKTQKERKELLSQFMGLTIFDRLYTQIFRGYQRGRHSTEKL